MLISHRLALLSLTTFLFMACGDDTESSNNSNGDGDTDNNSNGDGDTDNDDNSSSEPFERGEDEILDTSAFEGTILWRSIAQAVHIDLASNQETILRKNDPEIDDSVSNVQIVTGAAVSLDGSVAATVLESIAFCDLTFEGIVAPTFGSLVLHEVAAGTDTELPVSIDAETCRSATQPSLDETGSTVAYVERIASLEEVTSQTIMVWDGSTEPVAVTSADGFSSFAPILSADASSIVFLSDRADDGRNELYIVDATAGAEPRLLDVTHPDLDTSINLGQIDFPSCSDDLSRCIFIEGSDVDARIALLVETATGDATRVGPMGNVGHATISGDGNFALLVTSVDDVTKFELTRYDLSAPQSPISVGVFDGFSLAARAQLNADGSTIAASTSLDDTFGEANGFDQIVLMNADGSNLTLVESDETDEEFFMATFSFR